MNNIESFLHDSDSDDESEVTGETCETGVGKKEVNGGEYSFDDDIDLENNEELPGQQFEGSVGSKDSEQGSEEGEDVFDMAMAEEMEENENENDDDEDLAESDNDKIDISFLHDKYQKQKKKRIDEMKQLNDIENEVNEQEKEKMMKQNQVNWLSIPWEGNVPKILNFSKTSETNQTNETKNEAKEGKSDKQIRKIWFARWMQDKRKQCICIWDIPMTWNQNDVKNVFSMFGPIRTASLQHTNDIINRQCILRFEDSLSVETALAYDSSCIVQPFYQGSVKLGTTKWTSEYIDTRLRNLDKMESEVNKFMEKYDTLCEKRIAKEKMMPRRLRGWIQTRTEDGWTNVHYPNKFERKRNRAYRVGGDDNPLNIKLNQINSPITSINNNNNNNKCNENKSKAKLNPKNIKIHAINPNDTMNAPPERRVYDKNRKSEYYQVNRIKDTHAKRDLKKKRKQEKMKKQVKTIMHQKGKNKHKEMSGVLNNNNNKSETKRTNLKMERLRKFQFDGTRRKTDLAKTTQLRKNRRFKPAA